MDNLEEILDVLELRQVFDRDIKLLSGGGMLLVDILPRLR